MRRIAGPGHQNNRFVDYDAATNPQGTVYTADYGNDVQDELLAIQADAGLPEAPGADANVLTAIKSIADTIAQSVAQQTAQQIAGDLIRVNNEQTLPLVMQATNSLLLLENRNPDTAGHAVAVSGDYIVAANPWHDRDAVPSIGAAYVFRRVGENSWSRGVILTGGTRRNTRYGESVAIDGDYIVVGAPVESTSASDASLRGAVFINRRVGDNTWSVPVRINPPNANTGDTIDYFGFSVAIAGDYVVVGAPREDIGGNRAGSSFVFHRTGENVWDAGVMLAASDAAAGDEFGFSVAIAGDYVVVGAPFDDDGGTDTGSVYVFHRTGVNTWDSGVKLTATDAADNDQFGYSVAIDGDHILVGAPFDDDGDDSTGSVYVFHRTGVNTWDSGTKIAAPFATAGGTFGYSVAIDGDYLVVGSRGAGLVHLFRRGPGQAWSLVTTLGAPASAIRDRFGHSVAIGGGHIVVGEHDTDGPGEPDEAWVFRNLSPLFLPPVA